MDTLYLGNSEWELAIMGSRARSTSLCIKMEKRVLQVDVRKSYYILQKVTPISEFLGQYIELIVFYDFW